MGTTTLVDQRSLELVGSFVLPQYFGNSLIKGSSFDRLFGILPPCFRPFRWLQIAQSSFMDPDFAMLIEKVVA
jgi:hypothetical protein